MQRRVLIRASNLAAMRRALVDGALAGEPLAARRRALIVPSRASAELLRQSIEGQLIDRGAVGAVLPEMLTREEWLARLHAALPGPTRWLNRIERHMLFERAARHVLATRRFDSPPFRLRPGLVAAMLEFHDEVRRRGRSVRRLAGALFDELRVERGTDRGSDSLINLTCFLGFAFLAFDRAVHASGGDDEHTLRSRLLAVQPPLPFDDLIVAVADHPADPRGLWPVDFDLIGRLTGIDSIQVVMTDDAHDAGFRDRIEDELPGIEEVRGPVLARDPRIVTTDPPRDPPVFVARDREEELRDVARAIRARAEAHGGTLPGPAAVVFHRPLPYLYLAQQVLTDAGIPYQAFDALPLASEPYAAYCDLALTAVRTGYAREDAVALLRSPLFRIVVDDEDVSLEEVQALERVLVERRSIGDARSLVHEVDAFGRSAAGRRGGMAERARRAARAAGAVADELDACLTASAASMQVRGLAGFLRAHDRDRLRDETGDGRAGRGRAAVLGVLETVAESFERHDDRPRTIEELGALLRHVVEAQTFAPARHVSGVHLVDAAAARFGEFDDVYLVGLVDTDWGERPRRNVFYASPLLKMLGWPQDQDRVRAQQAAFRDVLTLGRQRTRLSAFQLDADAIVAISTMVDAARGLPVIAEVARPRQPLFADEVLPQRLRPTLAASGVLAWFDARRARPQLSDRSYGGIVPARAAEIYRVSRVERYIACPFKYFAEHVLRLPDDREQDAGLTPLERGTLLHAIFEEFYRTWDAAGMGGITPENLPDAERLFTETTDKLIADLPDADRTLERMRLIGSVVAPGVADRVFALEIAAGLRVANRLIEHELNGTFTFPVRAGLDQRQIQIRGKADRIDVLSDGRLRVVDYKLGRMPDLEVSVQIGVYAHCAQQALQRLDGQVHPIAAASYLAFGDERSLEGPIGRKAEPAEIAVLTKAEAFAVTVAQIEAGEFPPRPRRPSGCQWCGYAMVCRKEYRLDTDDDATESV